MGRPKKTVQETVQQLSMSDQKIVETLMTAMSQSFAQQVQRTDAGFYNSVSGLGGSRDKGIYNTIAKMPKLQQHQLEALLENNAVARRIIELPPGECVREGFEVMASDLPDKVDNEVFNYALQDLEAIPALFEAHRTARWFGGAAVWIGAEDRLDTSQPLDLNRVERINFLKVVDRYELIPESYQDDPTKPGLWEPVTYRLNSLSNSSGKNWKSWDGIIHSSRLLRFDGIKLNRRLSQENNGWGDSVFQSIWDHLSRFESAEMVMHNILQEFKYRVFKLKGWRDVLSSPEGKELVQKRFELMSHMMSVVNSVVLSEDEEVDSRLTPTTGLPEMHARLAYTVAAVAEIPATLLFGMSPGGLSTDDAAGRTYLYDRICAMQKTVYIPHLRRICEILSHCKDGPTEGHVPKRIVVKPNPLVRPTPMEVLQMKKEQAGIDQIYVQIGALTPDQVKRNRFSGAGYSFDTVLTEEELAEESEDISQEDLNAYNQAMSAGGQPEPQPEDEEKAA